MLLFNVNLLCRILNDNDDDISKDNAPGTPTQNRHDPHSPAYDSASLTNGDLLSSGKTPKLVTPFSKRTNRFDVKFSFNNIPDLENGKQELNQENDEDDIVRKVHPRKRCSLVVLGSGPITGCRFMYDRTEDRVCIFSVFLTSVFHQCIFIDINLILVI